MKTLEYVKNHIDDFERDELCDRRFTCRLLDFVDESEWEKFGFRRKEGAEPKKPKEWTEENVLKFVNSLGGDFDEVRIADPEVYRVFKNTDGNYCNFGD